ncbi:hypothetical protein HMF8227_02262 [Saliniradius amylolyticus]|uniref:Inner membrane protein n=1 Tax=Saliniradius amylolyticus TaxID=2183582 RepID=A0A2S2E4Z1_9ALTE|nr:metal-dependent hydrolase [Saliniradius amylolyticus]AWL12715.1 hypothetical protein HMF8227_02262 [Saliniradius amylolyticus]
MDPITHGIVGAALARSVSVIRPPQNHSESHLWWQLGVLAALIPDLDYLLFWVDPLAFLAYWHRSFTHSLFLAPLWSLTIAAAAYLLTAHRYPFVLLWLVATAGVLSHCFLDALTPFGTQWFQPFSDVRVSANLLLVVDGYFTLILLVCLWLIVKHRSCKSVLLVWFLPVAYLLVVVGIKQQIRQELSQQLPSNTTPSDIRLFPQPFSPLLWQAITHKAQGNWRARVFYRTNFIPLPLDATQRLSGFTTTYQPSHSPDWQWKPLWPNTGKDNALAKAAWHQPNFAPFRDFAQYPVLYHLGPLPPHSPAGSSTCFWFSDLRYHWPGIPPAFRFGLCQQHNGQWQTHRLPYLSIP